MSFPPIQDPAEAFLLQQSQVLISAPRPVWPQKPEPFSLTKEPFPSASASSSAPIPLTAFLPNSLKARDRRQQKNERVEERVALGSAFLPIDRDRRASESEPDADRARRIPSPEESDEWKRQKRKEEFERAKALEEVYDLDASGSEDGRRTIAKDKARRMSGASGGRTGVADDEDEDDDESRELCVICLQGVRDRTVLGECGHQGFCFDCINVWANQSRRCPLCTAPMSQFLLHNLDSVTGPAKFYLPPLPSVRPQPLPTTFASTLALRPSVNPFRQRGPEILTSDRDTWNRLRVEREREEEEDLLERAIERRREIYRHGMFAKHIASNIHTRYKPVPTPRQFAENADMISRATSFLRRELRVWRNVDVEFLTTYIISLMRSIDIRSEPAVRLLADFLDQPGAQGRDRRGAEHFAHEVYSFLRSPYRDLALYDAIAQYDPFPGPSIAASPKKASPPPNGNIAPEEAPPRRPSVSSSSSLDSYSPDHRHRANSIYTSSSQSRSRSRSRSPHAPKSRRSRSPTYWRRERTRPPPLSPRRWDQHDTYAPTRSPPRDRRRPGLPPQEEEMRRKLRDQPGRGYNGNDHDAQRAGRNQNGGPSQQRYARRDDRDAERARWLEAEAERKRTKERIASTGMRGWGETLPDDREEDGLLAKVPHSGRGETPERQQEDDELLLEGLLDEHDQLDDVPPSPLDLDRAHPSRATEQNRNAKPSLSMRIFGVAGKNLKQYLNEALRAGAAVSRGASPMPLSQDMADPGRQQLDIEGHAAAMESVARAVLSRAGSVDEDRLVDEDIWGVDPELDRTDLGIAFRGPPDDVYPTEVDVNMIDVGTTPAVDYSSTTDSMIITTSAPGSAADRARNAIAKLERSRIERKEKLLAKLLRERMARNRNAALAMQTVENGTQEASVGIAGDIPQAINTEGETTIVPPVDLAEMEAKARARLRLKMKLTKAKAEAAASQTSGSENGVGKVVVAGMMGIVTSEHGSVAMGAEENSADRAATLRAMLLAKKAKK